MPPAGSVAPARCEEPGQGRPAAAGGGEGFLAGQLPKLLASKACARLQALRGL